MDKDSKITLRSRESLQALYSLNGLYKTAKLLGVGYNTVRRWLDRHKIERFGKIDFDTKHKPRFNKTNTIYNNKSGYQELKEPGKRERRLHRVVMEIHLGRTLNKDEHVHHIDGDKHNNIIDNLWLTTNSNHRKAHYSMQDLVYEMYKNGTVYFDHLEGIYKLKNRNKNNDSSID